MGVQVLHWEYGEEAPTVSQEASQVCSCSQTRSQLHKMTKGLAWPPPPRAVDTLLKKKKEKKKEPAVWLTHFGGSLLGP